MITFKLRYQKRPLRSGAGVQVFTGHNGATMELTGELTLRDDEIKALWKWLQGQYDQKGNPMDIEVEVTQG